jgi:hypothetical protein
MGSQGAMSAARGFAVACAAALAASVGDLALLQVGTAPLSVPAPHAVLALGGLLGVAGIPLYALGYHATAARLCAQTPRGARIVRGAGALAAVIGAAIHAATALAIGAQLAAGSSAAPAPDPLAAVGESPVLVALWAAAGVCFAVANVPLTWRALRGPERWALANPVVLTLALAALGASFELGRRLLVPAAPNLAHLAFFGLGAARARGAKR